MKLCLVVVAAMLSSASAADIVAAGFKTNFDMPENWRNMVHPYAEGQKVDSCTIGGETPISTTVPVGMVNVGQKIVLKGSSKIILSSSNEDNAKIVLTENNIDAVPAFFIAAQDEDPNHERFDFTCHKNWKKSGSGEPVDRPPCHGDNAIFPSGSSYFVQNDPDDSDVPAYTLDSIFVGSQRYQSLDALPSFFFLDENIASLGNDAATCVANHVVDEDGDCLCLSSCPDAAQRQEQQNEIRDANERSHNDELEKLNVVVNMPFQSKYGLSTLGELATVARIKDLAVTDQEDVMELKARIRTHLAMTLGVEEDAITNLVTTLDEGTEVLTVTGNVNATKSTFLAPGQAVEDLPPAIMTTRMEGADQTGLQSVNDAVFAAVLEMLVAEVKEDADTGIANATSCDGCVADLDQYVDSIGENIEDPGTVRDVLELCMAEADVLACLETEFPLEAFKNGTTEADRMAFLSDMENLIDELKDLDPAVIADNLDAVDNASDFLDDKNDADDTQQMGPQEVTASAVISAGFQKTLHDLQAFTNAQNREGIFDSVADLAGRFGMRSVDRDSITMTLVNSPRRAVTDSHLDFEFDFVTLCEADANCNITSGHAHYEDVQSAIDAILGTHTIVGPNQCWDAANGNYSATCLADIAANAYTAAINSGQTEEQAIQAAQDAYKLNAECDERGRMANGDCFGVHPDYDRADAVAASSAAQTTFNSRSTGGSSGGLPIIPIAAAVGGLLLIVLIVFLVMRSRNNSTKPSMSGGDDRNVVAFENPMYDDPGQTVAASQPTYDDANASEGLYDEPAFAATADKSNPLYESQEDLAGFEDGYLDTEAANEDGGYLDVAPDM